MAEPDLYDGMTPAEWAASIEEETFKEALYFIYRTIESEVRDLDADGVDIERLQRRIIDAITYDGLVEHHHTLAEAKAAAEADKRREDKDVVRKRGDVGATWHRPLTAKTTACGKPIPDDPETGQVGDEHVIRSFLCGSCLRMPKNLVAMRKKREHYEKRR